MGTYEVTGREALAVRPERCHQILGTGQHRGWTRLPPTSSSLHPVSLGFLFPVQRLSQDK